MGLLYHWRNNNYQRDIQELATADDLVLEQNSVTLRDARAGESLFALTRRADGVYVLAAQFLIAAVRPSATGARYGRFSALPKPGSTILFNLDVGADVEPILRESPLHIAAGTLGSSFQGPAAVRRLDGNTERRLTAFAARQPHLPSDGIGALRALVLADQERTAGGAYDHWDDITGEQYHFPNTYRRKVQPGLPFIYYRGTRRANGRRGTPGYFGVGRIGQVWEDPSYAEGAARNRRWYCRIVDYVPFQELVPWMVDQTRIENIPRNLFQNGVRDISLDTYFRVLALAGIQSAEAAGSVAPAMPPFDLVGAVMVPEGTTLLAPALASPRLGLPGAGYDAGRHRRRSRYSSAIGRRAEEIALRFLKESVPGTSDVADIAGQGATPGWDIEYVGPDGERFFVEVKGTTARRFADIEITTNEWAAAQNKGQRYQLLLVADCLSRQPVVEIVPEPHTQYERGTLRADPVVLSLRRVRS